MSTSGLQTGNKCYYYCCCYYYYYYEVCNSVFSNSFMAQTPPGYEGPRIPKDPEKIFLDPRESALIYRCYFGSDRR